MNKYICKGKLIDKDEYVCGYYVFQRKRLGKFGQTLSELDKDRHIIVDLYGNSHEVIPQTVGRFTGLKDIEGRPIFEHDIIKHFNGCAIKACSEDIGRVFYYSETCRFLRTSNLFPDDCPEIDCTCSYEIIGTEYDNPELLTGGISDE